MAEAIQEKIFQKSRPTCEVHGLLLDGAPDATTKCQTPEAPCKGNPKKCGRDGCSGPIATNKQRVRYIAIVSALAVAAVALAFGVLSYNNGMPFGSEGY